MHISVKNIKDEADLLREIQFSVEENISIGTTLGKVKFSANIDADLSDFRFRGEDENLFDIDQNGSITLAQQLDYEISKYHIVDILASKDGKMVEAVSMKITVLDTADVSPIIEDLNSSIDENATVGTEIGRIKISNNGDSEITSFILSGEGNENFTVDFHGMIRLASNVTLDYEKQKKYTLSAKASSASGESKLASVEITVNNIIDVKPILKNLSLKRRYDSFKLSQTIGNIMVESGDTSIQSVTLSPVSPFMIESNGSIVQCTPLDSNTTIYRLSAQAENGSGVSNTALVTIEVDGTPILADTNLSVDENSLAGTAVGEINITDQGMGHIERFTLESTLFEIEANGTVYVSQGTVLDYEITANYTLEVKAQNRFGISQSALLEITLNNKIDLPVLQDVNTTIPSNTVVGTVIGNVLMMGGDTPIDTFVLEQTQTFGIEENGDVYLKKPLYEESNASYNLQAYAKIDSLQSETVIVNIEVQSSIINTIDTPHSANDMVLSLDGTKAFVADGESGLQIIDVSNVMEAQIIGSVDTPDYASAVVLANDASKAYVSDGYSGLQIIDISDASAPEIISSINTLGYAHSITLSIDGTKVLIADGYSGLQIVDVGNPVMPEIVGSIDTPDYAQSITLSKDGTKAFIADGYSGLQIVDVSNPTIPVIISSLDTPGYARDITLSTDGTKVFIADSGSGLQVVDISNITIPIIISSMDTSAFDIKLSTDGTKIFLVGYSNLQIVDISDITAPNIVRILDIPYANAVVFASDDSKVYVANRALGVQIIDIRQIEFADKVPGLYTPPISVDEKTSIGSVVGQMVITYAGNDITSMVLQGEGSEDFTINLDGLIRLVNPLDHVTKNQYDLKVLASNSVGTREVDVMIRVHTVPEISDFSTTVNSMSNTGTLVGKLDMWVDDETTIHSISLSGEGYENFTINTKGEIYVAPDVTLHHFITEEYNLSVVAVNSYGSAEASKVHIDVSAIVFAMEDLVGINDVLFSLDGTKAYMLSDKMGLQIIDISDMKSPKVMQVVDLPDYVESMVLSKDENKVFVANGDSGLQIVDVNDAKKAAIIGAVPDLTYAYDIVLSSDDTKAFIADISSGLKVINISDPTAAQIIGSVDTGGKANKVVLSIDNTKAFVGNNDYPDYKFQVIDVTDPREPVLIASLDTSGSIESMVTSPNGTELFVANWSLGLQIIDISDPTLPKIINTIETDGTFHQLTLSPDGTKTMALDYNALQVIDIQESMNPIALGTVDNIYYSAGIDISSDGMQVIVADWGNGVYVIDLVGLE